MFTAITYTFHPCFIAKYRGQACKRFQAVWMKPPTQDPNPQVYVHGHVTLFDVSSYLSYLISQGTKGTKVY